MAIPERFSNLPEYPFPRLRALLDPHPPGAELINMTIGEPRHDMPGFVPEVLAECAHEFGRYPPNEGAPELLEAAAGWASRRYRVAVDPARLITLNGSREGLFNAALALCPERKAGGVPLVAMPNPFYQVYAVAAAAVGAEPLFLPATADTGHLPDYAGLPAAVLDRIAIAYLCTPANPQGAVAGPDYLDTLMRLAEKHDFIVFSDECYSEIYTDTPPGGALTALARTGTDPERLVVFQSLSKRSNLPGMRSGFAVAGPQSITAIRRLRAYAGAPLPLPLQRVAARAWGDEAHVEASRARYRTKFAIADAVLGDLPGYRRPEAGFLLWLPVEDSAASALKLWRETGVRVLPGAYLGREVAGQNPGEGYLRVALVASEDDIRDGLTRLRQCLFG